MNCSSGVCIVSESSLMSSCKHHPDVSFALREVRRLPNLRRHICLVVNDIASGEEDLIKRMTAILYEITNRVLCRCAIKYIIQTIVGDVGDKDARYEMTKDITGDM